MKKNKIKKIAVTLIATLIVLGSCKKDPGPTGISGPQGNAGPIAVSNDGFIKGTVIGTRKDGTAFNYIFNFTSYMGSTDNTIDSTAEQFTFSVSRSGSVFSRDRVSLQIVSLTKVGTITGIIGSSFNIDFQQPLSGGGEFIFSEGTGLSPVFTNVVYNSGTSVISGDYSLSIPGSQNSTGNPATVSGSFQSAVNQLYYFTKHNSTTKLD